VTSVILPESASSQNGEAEHKGHEGKNMRRNRRAKAQQLAEVRLFHGCSPEELDHLARITDDAIFEDGQILCEQGDVGTACYVLVDGEVDVVVRHEVVATVSAGETVGEMALLDGRPRSATLIARGQLHALVIDAERFADLVADSPYIATALLRELSRRLRATDLTVAQADAR
jgi:CRP/FNR family cyclic AMP-dependent transcriptional regulator